MSDGDPNEKIGPYFSLLPELTLTSFDFDALSLREEDIANLLSPSQHPLDFSPDFQDFADLAQHVLSDTDAINNERQNCTGEWERELFGRHYNHQHQISEGPITPDLSSPMQYPLDLSNTQTATHFVMSSLPPHAGAALTREQSDGAQAESELPPIRISPAFNAAAIIDEGIISRRQLNRPLTVDTSSGTWHQEVQQQPRARDIFPLGAPSTLLTTAVTSSSSENSRPVSSASSSRRSIQGRRRAEGGNRRATNSANVTSGSSRGPDARLQRKRASESSSDSSRQPRTIAAGSVADTTNFASSGGGGGVGLTARNSLQRREGPSDGFDAGLDVAPFGISGSETSDDPAGSGNDRRAVAMTSTGAGFFFDQPRGEPMGSEGGMIAPVVTATSNTRVLLGRRRRVSGGGGVVSDSSERESEIESVSGRARDYVVRSMSGEDGALEGGSDLDALSVRRTDWLRGTVEGADDADNLASATAATATQTIGNNQIVSGTQLPASWWQPTLPISGGGGAPDSDYPFPLDIGLAESNIRPPLVGQSEENRCVTAAVGSGGSFGSVPEIALGPAADHRSGTPESNASSEPGVSSSRTSQPVSSSTLASKDSLAHRVNDVLHRGSLAPPDWLADYDDDEEEEEVPVASGTRRTRTDYPLESMLRRQYLSARCRDAKVVSFGKSIENGESDVEEGAEDDQADREEEDSSESSMESRFGGANNQIDGAKEDEDENGTYRETIANSDVHDNRGHLSPLDAWQSNEPSVEIVVPPLSLPPSSIDPVEQLAKHTDELQFGLSSLELTDAEHCPPYAAARGGGGGGVDQSAEANLQHNQQRAISPSVQSVCSVASSKRLEWDSGADIGYGGARVLYGGLSTLERMAIGSSTVFRRMEPEGKSGQANNAAPNANVAQTLSLPGTVISDSPHGDDACDAYVTGDENASIIPDSDFSGVLHRRSRSSDQCLSSRHLVVEAGHQVARSCDTVVGVDAEHMTETPIRAVQSTRSRRSNSMINLSRSTVASIQSPLSPPLLCADDRRHSASTSDIKGDGSSNGRLYKLIHSWFSTTSSGMSASSSGGTVVPVSGMATSPPFRQQLCSTTIDGSGSSTRSGRQPRLSFHTPAITTTHNKEATSVSQKPTDSLSKYSNSAITVGARSRSNEAIVTTAQQTVKSVDQSIASSNSHAHSNVETNLDLEVSRQHQAIPALTQRFDTHLTVPGQPNRNQQTCDANSSNSPTLASGKAVPPPITRAEQEAKLLAFAEKFVSSLCPSANPARRLKMAGRILADIGALLKVAEPPGTSTDISVKTSTTTLAENSGTSDKNSLPRATTFTVKTADEMVAPVGTREPGIVSRQNERHSSIKSTDLPSNKKVNKSSISAQPPRHQVPDTTSVPLAPFSSAGSRKDTPGNENPCAGLAVTADMSTSIYQPSNTPRILTSSTTSSVSVQSNSGDYYIVRPFAASNRPPLDRRYTNRSATATDSDAVNSTETHYDTTISTTTATITSNNASIPVQHQGWSSTDEFAGPVPRGRVEKRHDSRAPRTPEHRRSARRDSGHREPTSTLSTRGSLSTLFGAIGQRTINAVPHTVTAATANNEASPESVRLLRELVQRQRRRYMKTLQKEVAWLEKVELILGRKKERSPRKGAARVERSPRKVIDHHQTSITNVPATQKRANEPQLQQFPPFIKPVPSRQLPVKVTRDFGQSYPTPCPSVDQRHRSARRRSASVGSRDDVTTDDHSTAVHSDEGRGRGGDAVNDRPIVIVPSAVVANSGGEKLRRSGLPMAVRVRKRATSVNRHHSSQTNEQVIRSDWTKDVEQPRRLEKNGVEVPVRRAVAYFLPCVDGGSMRGRSSRSRSRADGQRIGDGENVARTLQDAFIQRRAATVQRMESRQRLLRAVSAKREMSQPLQTEVPSTGTIVINLLDVQNRHRKYTMPLPLSGQHHRPVPRDFTHQQMRSQTERVFQDLPEVTRKLELKRRESTRQSNRLIAQRFNKKLQEFALRGKVSLRHTQKCL